MHGMIEALRESFTPYLAAGIAFSFAAIWAAIMAAGRVEQTPDQTAETRKRS